MPILFILFLFLSTVVIAQENPLSPLETDTPEKTLQTFLDSMNHYKKGLQTDERRLQEKISRAIRTLDLGQTPLVLRDKFGKQSAIYLKEVIDRVWTKPSTAKNIRPSSPSQRWRLDNTEIIIIKIDSGKRKGEFLFHPDTVARAKEFYEKVKHLPYLTESGQGALFHESWLETSLPEHLKIEVFGYSLWQWTMLILSLLFGYIIKWFTNKFFHFARKLTYLSNTSWDNKLVETAARPAALISMSIFWFLSIRTIGIDGILLESLNICIQLVFSIGIIWVFYGLADMLAENIGHLFSKNEFTVDLELFGMVRKILRVSVIVIGSLIATQNLGINILSLVAGLGIGGLAFALAAKDTAANLFGSLMIFSDRPFRVGDWIVFENTEGRVESVGFRSTRIRTFYNSQISIPNGVIANACIDNLGRRKFRRVKTTLGLTYDTPPEKLEAFLEGLKNVIKANHSTRKDYFHVVFHNFGDSSLEILVYFFLQVDSWAEELVERQNVLMEFLRLAKRLEVDFAFPTQSLHIETFPEKSPLNRHANAWDEQKLRETAKHAGPAGKDAKPAGLGIFLPPHKDPT